MEQILTGILIGVVLLAAIALAVLLIVAILRVVKQVETAIKELQKVTEVFQKSADMSASLVSLVMVNRKMISSIEGMTAAVKVFTGLVLREEPEGGEAAPAVPNYSPSDWMSKIGRPPSPSLQPDEPGEVLSQTDEEMAEVELQNEVHAHGDVSAEEILAAQQPEQIRANV